MNMIIIVTELKKHLNKYLDMVSKEDIIITKYGKVVARLTNPKKEYDILNSLIGIAKGNKETTLYSIREERLGRQ